MTTLSKDELAYGQQKNREYAWEQAKEEHRIFRFKRAVVLGREIPWDETDTDSVDCRYIELCKQSNITPW